MRKSKAETAETRRRIVEQAARTFRLHGIQATGLNDVMTPLGLTQGGFYRHFTSKDQLVAEACTQAMSEVIAGLEAAADKKGTGGKRANSVAPMIDAYISTAHRDTPTGGCPLAAMGSELAHADPQTRKAAARGFDDLRDALARRLADKSPEEAKSAAAFALAAMIGAITMSRVIEDSDASMALLDDVKRHLAAL
ncbi:TetR/AcrR family transcriptional regulator [Cupriavidus plantarum]|uniref:TetR/AcrR family transcriptional regulator n=1 Tax=Cupriavidus plantarum TaxID=942865 RepID=UPI000EAEEB09|nr:TetR/AcrR family transcriptional regulator [Cupriavidus plantarum]NYI01720.1 TetR/AcrR family transcriptional repressor of nem operon [Cupriavidus plantarum]RLK33706.1 TetR family transcriptional regulator [Cupriavidus plantarum]